MNKQDLTQAIKAYIVQELEETYCKREQEAYFSAQIDHRVINLQFLIHTNPLVAIYIQPGVDSLIATLVKEELESCKRELTKDEELILEAYIDGYSEVSNFLGAVQSCKELINLK